MTADIVYVSGKLFEQLGSRHPKESARLDRLPTYAVPLGGTVGAPTDGLTFPRMDGLSVPIAGVRPHRPMCGVRQQRPGFLEQIQRASHDAYPTGMGS